MEKQNFWDLAFISIASLRLHPRNVQQGDDLNAGKEIAFAAHIADVMTKIKQENLKWRG